VRSISFLGVRREGLKAIVILALATIQKIVTNYISLLGDVNMQNYWSTWKRNQFKSKSNFVS